MSAKVLIPLLAVSALLMVNCPLAVRASDTPPVAPSVAQVVKLHDSGVSADVLLAYVKETPIARPNADEVLYMTEKGIPKEVIVAMLSKRVWVDTPAPQSQPAPAQNNQLPPAVSQAQPASQTVVHVQQPAPTVTYVSPAPAYYYDPYYYNPWPAFAVGVGIGYGWGGWGHYGYGHGGWGHGGWNHGGGIHVHHH